MSAPIGWRDARSSAVLVKEMRAALRGKLFRLTFVCTLAVACVVAVSTLSGSIDTPRAIDGRAFFLPVYVCFCVALFALVPFSAFTSMGAEWDEGTIELLVASDLRPRQIVIGKLCAAAIEALLYASAVAPFLAFAFLMQGVDALGLTLVFLATIAGSIAYAAVALWLSTLSKLRVARVLLLVALAAGAIALVVGASEFANDLLRSSMLGGRGRFGQWLALALACSFCATFALAFACQRLAHEEENRSSPARVVASAWIVVMIAWMGVEASLGGRVPLGDLVIGMLSALTILHLFFATEAERLPRRVRTGVPRSFARALLSAPFLPGGARGVLLFAAQVALVFAGAFAVHSIQGPRSGEPSAFGWRHIDRDLVFGAYAALYVVLGSLVASRWSASRPGRIAARVAIPIVVACSILLPGLFGVFFGVRRWSRLEHGANPFEMYARFDQPEFRSTILFVFGLLAFSVAASVPRLARGVREVLQASRAKSEAS